MLDKTIPSISATPAQAIEAMAPGQPVSIKFNVNGVMRSVAVEPQATLAEVLRGPLNLTGTKIGCDRGTCSACTVWLDHIPIVSCMMLAVDVGQREITTIEGLARDSELHPVQSAFIDHDAVQCGFCTPGLVMSCAALLNSNPDHRSTKSRLWLPVICAGAAPIRTCLPPCKTWLRTGRPDHDARQFNAGG